MGGVVDEVNAVSAGPAEGGELDAGTTSKANAYPACHVVDHEPITGMRPRRHAPQGEVRAKTYLSKSSGLKNKSGRAPSAGSIPNRAATPA